MNVKQALGTWPQYILPHHPLSRLMRRLTHSENTRWKNFFIHRIINHYGVNMQEALAADIAAYPSFNHFFTRALKPEVRPITTTAQGIACPADGAVSQAGDITAGNIIQAKGKNYSLQDLLGGDTQRAAAFAEGKFATVYLSPKDYHRLHMPIDGTLEEMLHIPGRLFSVNAATANVVPRLFARNERVVCNFATAAGPMALILVGALFVASIETVWHGEVTPPTTSAIQSWQYEANPPKLKRGEEMGRFNMGSTIIVLFGKDSIRWENAFAAGANVKLGQRIGLIL